MARTRQVTPGFFSDEDLATRCSPMARLLFVGLWTLADRKGRLEDRPLKIKAALFPYEAVDADALLRELAQPKEHGVGAFILRYEANGRKYLQVCNFEKYQKCHPKEPAGGFPEPAVKGNGEPCKATARQERAVYVQPESVPSLSSVPSVVRKAEAVIGNGPAVRSSPPNPLLGDRPAREREALTLAARLAEINGTDPAEEFADAAHYKGAERRKVNPAAMSDDRLLNTLMDLRANVRAAESKIESRRLEAAKRERAERLQA